MRPLLMRPLKDKLASGSINVTEITTLAKASRQCPLPEGTLYSMAGATPEDLGNGHRQHPGSEPYALDMAQ
jgi:hypothetical protein